MKNSVVVLYDLWSFMYMAAQFKDECAVFTLGWPISTSQTNSWVCLCSAEFVMAANLAGMAFIPYYRHIIDLLDTNAELKKTAHGKSKEAGGQ